MPAFPVDAETGFAGEWESFELKDENIVVKAKYGNGTAVSPYLISTATQFQKMMKDFDDNVNTTYFKFLNDIDVSSLETTELGASRFTAVIDGNGYDLKGLTVEKLSNTNGCLIAQSVGTTIKNLGVELSGRAVTLINNIGFGTNNVLENVTFSGSAELQETEVGGNKVINSLFVNSITPEDAGTETLVLFKNCMNKANLTYTGETTSIFNIFIGNIANNAGVSFNGSNETIGGISGVSNVRKSPTAQTENEAGFCAWTEVTVGENVYLKPVVSDGTEQSPYLVKNATQFELILTNYTDANPHYFKLIADIDLTGITASGKNFVGGIDGNNHTLLNLNGDLFAENEGSMFSKAKDCTIKDLNIKLGNTLATLVDQAWGVTLENITVSNMDGALNTYVGYGDNNESPFVCHVMDGVNTFENCINNANIVSAADYMGVFVGGYAWDDTTVVFKNCENNGNIRTAGSVGILFGNGSHRAPSITVENFKNTGVITAYKESHVLISHQKGKFSEDFAQYDHLSTTEIKSLDTNCIATINGENMVVMPKGSTSMPAGKYQLVLSAFAGNKDDRTLRTSIVLTKDIEAEDSGLIYENAVYGMMDAHSYVEMYGENSLDNANWTDIEGYIGIRYWADETNKCYVVDYSGYEELYNLQENTLKLNADANKVEKIIIVRQDNGDINFVVDFGTETSASVAVKNVDYLTLETYGDDGMGNPTEVGFTVGYKLNYVEAKLEDRVLTCEESQDGENYVYKFAVGDEYTGEPVTVIFFNGSEFRSLELGLSV